jgi:hypothetical protein
MEGINKMEDKNLQNPSPPESEQEDKIIRNDDYAAVKESAVVIEEEDRTVLLTDDETIIIEKEEPISVVPKNRPRKVYMGMWGRTEIATVGLALLAILSVVFLHLFFVLPEKSLLEQNRTTRDRLESDLTSARKKYGDITDTETQVAKLINSVDDFESRFLPLETVGRTALYQRLNVLINAYRLTNTTGPDYRPLEISESERRRGVNEEEAGGRAKLRSIFPGVFVTVTVEGAYSNLRGFIREIETSSQFIIINTVELEPAENEEKPNQATTETTTNVPLDPNDPDAGTIATKVVKKLDRGRVRGQTVTLRIEMAAYFRRQTDGNTVPLENISDEENKGQ